MSFDSLAPLGWDADWAQQFVPFSDAGLVPARVVAEHRSGYVVAGADGERDAVAAGRLRHEASDALPAVGDWVACAAPDDGTVVVRAVLPRRTAFVRRAAGTALRAQVVAANVDVVAVTTPLGGEPNARWLERFVAAAWDSGATPLVVLTKADLCADVDADVDAAVAAARLAAPGVDVVVVSALTGAGLDALGSHLGPGRTLVLLGASGAGKSTLVNALLGRERMATRDVRADGKGRHTTTHRELVSLPGGALLLDTPGMRELGLWAAGEGVGATFADVEALAAGCRFDDCVHDTEPGCAVRAAVDDGALDAARLAAWHKLRRELAHLARQSDPRLAAEHNAQIRALMRGYYRFVRDNGR